MRRAATVALLARLATLVACGALLAPTAVAMDETGDDAAETCFRDRELDARPAARLRVERRECEEASSWEVALTDPNGRSVVRWYDDERGVGIEAHRAPRFVAWWQDAEGCHLIVYAAGPLDVGCVAGAPPSPASTPAGYVPR